MAYRFMSPPWGFVMFWLAIPRVASRCSLPWALLVCTFGARKWVRESFGAEEPSPIEVVWEVGVGVGST